MVDDPPYWKSPQPNLTPVFLDYSFCVVTSPRIQDQNVSILVEFAQKPLDLINEQFNVILAMLGITLSACKWTPMDVYEALANSSCIWECVVCGLPNFSSSLFESSTIEATNYFWPLDTDLPDKSHIESIYTVNQLIYWIYTSHVDSSWIPATYLFAISKETHLQL